MNIERMLVVSTANITEKTCNEFLPSWKGPAYQKTEYGWFVYVQEETDNLPTDLEAVMHLARSENCRWVMLDRDAPEDSRLLIFDW